MSVLPEEKGSHLIENTPLSPGVCYTSTSDGENLALVRIETVAVQGSGKLNITGVNNTAVKENIKNTYQYIKANEKTILSDKHSLKNYDITIQVSNLLGAAISTGIGSAVYIAIVSALYKKNLKAGLAVLGNISVGSGDVVRHNPRSYPEAMSYVSFELEQRLIAKEESLDEARFFSGKIDTFVKSRDTICAGNPDSHFEKIVDQMGIRSLLDRGIRFLSTGEMRKILIARALMKSPSLLILDEPFEGLDVQFKTQLAELINNMKNGDSQLLLVTNRIEEITSNISHILCLKDNAVFLQGPREKVLASEKMPYLFEKTGPVALSLPLKKKTNTVSEKTPSPVLVEIKNTTVKYGDLLVMDNLNWSLKKR